MLSSYSPQTQVMADSLPKSPTKDVFTLGAWAHTPKSSHLNTGNTGMLRSGALHHLCPGPLEKVVEGGSDCTRARFHCAQTGKWAAECNSQPSRLNQNKWYTVDAEEGKWRDAHHCPWTCSAWTCAANINTCSLADDTSGFFFFVCVDWRLATQLGHYPYCHLLYWTRTKLLMKSWLTKYETEPSMKTALIKLRPHFSFLIIVGQRGKGGNFF